MYLMLTSSTLWPWIDDRVFYGHGDFPGHYFQVRTVKKLFEVKELKVLLENRKNNLLAKVFKAKSIDKIQPFIGFRELIFDFSFNWRGNLATEFPLTGARFFPRGSKGLKYEEPLYPGQEVIKKGKDNGMNEKSLSFLRELVETPSPSGFENAAQEVFRKRVGPFCA